MNEHRSLHAKDGKVALSISSAHTKISRFALGCFVALVDAGWRARYKLEPQGDATCTSNRYIQ